MTNHHLSALKARTNTTRLLRLSGCGSVRLFASLHACGCFKNLFIPKLYDNCIYNRIISLWISIAFICPYLLVFGWNAAVHCNSKGRLIPFKHNKIILPFTTTFENRFRRSVILFHPCFPVMLHDSINTV